MYDESVLKRFWIKVKKTQTCWLWQAQLNNMGYGCFRLSQPRRMVYAHRFAYELTKGAIPPGQFLLHSCDTPACVNPAHLTPGSAHDNMRDMAAKGRGNTTKLTVDQIREIRQRVKGHQSYGVTKELAEKFGVHRSQIRRAAKSICFVLVD